VFKINIIRFPLHKISLNLDLITHTTSKFTIPFIHGNPDEFVTHNSRLPSFMTFKFPEYSFYPENFLDIGNFVLKGQLWNPFTVTNFKLSVNVTNFPPFLPAGSLPNEILIEIDSKYNFKLPYGIYRED
jgi:hypothetical protein